MPSLSKYTQWKVIGGYSLLFLLSILAAVLIYKQITKLIVNEENSDNPNRKLFIIGNTITGLYESEGLGNAFVQTGSRSYFLKYRDLIEEVESNIDSLRDLTTRLDQILRLDTIDDLLDQKIRNLQDIVRVKQSFVPDDFYNKAIASIESGRDSLQGTDIRKDTYDTGQFVHQIRKKEKTLAIFFQDRARFRTQSFGFSSYCYRYAQQANSLTKYGQCRSYSENSLGRCTKTNPGYYPSNQPERICLNSAEHLHYGSVETNIRSL